jgi:hypothetical protein
MGGPCRRRIAADQPRKVPPARSATAKSAGAGGFRIASARFYKVVKLLRSTAARLDELFPEPGLSDPDVAPRPRHPPPNYRTEVD